MFRGPPNLAEFPVCSVQNCPLQVVYTGKASTSRTRAVRVTQSARGVPTKIAWCDAQEKSGEIAVRCFFHVYDTALKL